MAEHPPQPAKPVILVVDDEPALRGLERRALEMDGYAVREAENGEQALAVFQQAYPDLVLLDVLMPGMNGFETCERLRKLPGGEFTPILMVTALNDAISIESAFKAGALDFLTKPIQWAEMRHRIRRMLETKRVQEQVHFQASLLDQIGNAVAAMDKDMAITYWNHAAETLFLMPRPAVIGRQFAQVLTLKHMDGSKVAIEDSVHGIFMAENLYGHRVPVQAVMTVTSDYRNSIQGFVIIFTDDSEQQHIEQELRHSQSLYRTLINHIPNGAAVLFDKDLKFLIAGGMSLRELNFTREMVEGKSVRELFHDNNAAELEDLCQKALNGQATMIEATYQGRTYQLHVLPGNIEADESRNGMLIAQDITDVREAAQLVQAHRKELEALVEQRTAELVHANQSLQQEINERRRVEVALEYRIQFEKLITSISAYFINIGTSRVDEGVSLGLEAIGTFAKVDRSYVFQLSSDGFRMDNTFEWCAEGIDPHQALLQDVPTMIFPWLIEKLNALENIYIPRVVDMPLEAQVERKFFETRHCQSVILVPMVFDGKVAGFLGFDSVHTEKVWTDDLIALLKIVGETFINALQHKRAENALRQSEKQLRQITDTMLDSVYQTNIDGIVEFASTSCWATLGYQPEQFVGQSIYEHVHPEDVEGMKYAVHNVGIAEYRFQKESGDYVWLETLSNLVFSDDGKIEGIVFASRDITSRKNAERELHELNRLKTEFLSTAAHELRTPLTSIRGFSEILISRELPPERQARFLKLINEQSTQLGNLIDDLLDISRLEAKRNLTLSLELVDINALVRNLVAPFSESDTNHYFQIAMLSQCPPVLADPIRLSQVLKNLVSNAVKYSPAGGPITIQIRAYDESMEVSVRDQGIGMSPDQQVHLFEKFYRADASNTAVSGTGLGLAISKLIIELHGGKIWAESALGSGSTFYITLPIHPIPENEEENHEENPGR